MLLCFCHLGYVSFDICFMCKNYSLPLSLLTVTKTLKPRILQRTSSFHAHFIPICNQSFLFHFACTPVQAGSISVRWNVSWLFMKKMEMRQVAPTVLAKASYIALLHRSKGGCPIRSLGGLGYVNIPMTTSPVQDMWVTCRDIASLLAIPPPNGDYDDAITIIHTS